VSTLVRRDIAESRELPLPLPPLVASRASRSIKLSLPRGGVVSDNSSRSSRRMSISDFVSTHKAHIAQVRLCERVWGSRYASLTGSLWL
jgi:hypothetical protein